VPVFYVTAKDRFKGHRQPHFQMSNHTS